MQKDCGIGGQERLAKTRTFANGFVLTRAPYYEGDNREKEGNSHTVQGQITLKISGIFENWADS